MPHDLGRILEWSLYAPPAWQTATGGDTSPYPFWWYLDIAAGRVLAEADRGPPHGDDTSSTASATGRLPRPVPARLRGLLGVVPPRHVATADVLVFLPDKGWPTTEPFRRVDNHYLGSLIQRLQESGERVTTAMSVFCAPGAGGPLRALARGLPGSGGHVWLERFWDQQATRAAGQARRHFDRLLSRVRDVRELGFDSVAGPELLSWLRASIPSLAFHAGLMVAAANLLEATQPQVVVMAFEGRGDMRAITASAHAMDVPVVALQNGHIAPYSRGYLFAPKHPRLAAHVGQALPDVFAAFGPRYRGLLVDRGPWPSQRVAVTGCPAHDRLPPPPSMDARPILLWTTQAHAFCREENAAMRDILAAALDRLPPIDVVVKPHPRERPGDQVPLPTRSGARVLDAGTAFPDALRSAVAVVTRTSVTAVEAAATGRPVALLGRPGEADAQGFGGIGMEVADAADLEAFLQRHVVERRSPPVEWSVEAQRFTGPLDGRATARVATLVSERAKPSAQSSHAARSGQP